MHVSVFLDRTQRKGSSQEDILCAFWLHPRLFRLSLCPTMDKGDGWTVPGFGCTSLVVTVFFFADNGQRRWEDRSWFCVFLLHEKEATIPDKQRSDIVRETEPYEEVIPEKKRPRVRINLMKNEFLKEKGQ